MDDRARQLEEQGRWPASTLAPSPGSPDEESEDVNGVDRTETRFYKGREVKWAQEST